MNPNAKRAIITEHLRRIGSIGGSNGRGAAKARTTEQASRAATIRWQRWNEAGRPPIKRRPSPRSGRKAPQWHDAGQAGQGHEGAQGGNGQGEERLDL